MQPPVRSLLPLQALRLPLHLAAERALRAKMVSVQVSWKSTRSGLFAFGVFSSMHFPHRPHFPVTVEALEAYSAYFLNSDTFSAYLSHLRFGARMMKDDSLVPPAKALAGLLRGLKKATVHRPKPTLTTSETEALITSLTQSDDPRCLEVARLVAVGRSFLGRMQNEIFPLQASGKAGVYRTGEWHSQVDLTPASATIVLRSRKNAPEGASIERTCRCKPHRRSILSGVCSLRAQILSDPRRPWNGRVFTLEPAVALRLLHEHCRALGLPLITWHALRRSGARDLLASGSTLAQVLFAGGWRSAAFLR